MTNIAPFNPKHQEMLEKQIEAMDASIKSFNDNENKALKKLFSGKIKQNFLIEMKEMIMHKPDFFPLMMEAYDYMNLSAESLLIGKENSSLDVCKFITMIHFFNTLILDDQKRALLHDDKEYKEQLCNQVMDAIRIRKVALINNSKDSLEGYYPLTYAIYALNNFMLIKFDEMMQKKIVPIGKNGVFKSQMHLKMLNKVKSILLMVDNNLTEEAFNPLRSLVELFMIYFALYNADKAAVDEYSKHIKLQFEYQDTKIMPEYITNKVKELNKQGCNVTKTDYLNFGWLDSILEYGYIDKSERKYKIKDVAELLDMMYQKEHSRIGSTLYGYYRECSPMSHGFNGFLDRYTAKQNVLEKVSYILSYLAYDFEHQYKLNFKVNNIDLLKYLEKTYDKQLEYDKEIYNNPKLLQSLNNEYVHRIK